MFVLIFKAANEYCAHQFINNTTTDFTSINSMSFDDCIALYCSSLLQADSYTTIGLFTRFLIYNGKTENNYNNAYSLVFARITNYRSITKLGHFEKLLTRNNTAHNNYIKIDDIDLMTGLEFEEFISNMFIRLGYVVTTTKATGDQGIDIIAEKGLDKIGIQTKCYSSTVSNSAIQEVVAGKNHYNCNKAIVVTNNTFTQSAINLSRSNDVILWDRFILKEKISELGILVDTVTVLNDTTKPPIADNCTTTCQDICANMSDHHTMSIANFKPLTTNNKMKIITHAPSRNEYTGGGSHTSPPANCKYFDQAVELATKYATTGEAYSDEIDKLLTVNNVDELHLYDVFVVAYVNAVNMILNKGYITDTEEDNLCKYLEQSSYVLYEEYMEYLNATEKLIELIESQTGSLDIMFQNARLLDNKNEYTKALKLYERLISKYPFSSEAKHSKIYIDGINSRNNVSNIDVGSIAKNLYNQATLLEKNNEFDNAYTIYNKIIVDYPNSNEAKYSKSKLHYNKEYSNRPS